MHERILIGLKNASLIQRLIFRMAKWAGSTRIHGDWITQKKICGLATWVSEFLVGRKLRTKLGLDRARLLVTGSAPTRREVVGFFASFGLFIREVYGLSENLCLGVYQPSDRLLLESCGKAFMGNEVKIAGDGEILFRAPWLFKEYFRNPDASQDTMQGDWFATGDLGRLDERGFLYIVGRKKELLKTSTGKYVAPVPIEDQLKCLDVVTEAMLVGDNEKYCVALISISPNTSEDRLKDAILPHLESMNAKLAHHESIKRIGVLCKDFSVESGTLTPTLKLKRKNAFDQNKEFIRQIYEAKDTIVWQQS
jgi:long-chain acyl-CoA synthetase